MKHKKNIKRLLLLVTILAVSWTVLSRYNMFESLKIPKSGVHSPKSLVCKECNIILISLENLRKDRIGCYGYHRNTTPAIDILCKNSIVLENAYSQSGLSHPSFSSIFSSLYPSFHNVKKRGQILESSFLTFPEVLGTYDITNVAFVMGNNLGNNTGLNEGWDIRGFFGFDQGFEEYNDQYNDLGDIVPEALAWIEENSDRQFFLFLQTFNIHEPYKESIERALFVDNFYGGVFSNKTINNRILKNIKNHRFKTESGEKIPLTVGDKKYIIDKYDEQIPYVDNLLQKFFEGLEAAGLMETTIIMITAAHGEELFEEGGVGHGDLTKPILNVPLIIRHPRIEREKRINGLIQLIDIAPTILNFLGIPTPQEFQGKSILPLIENNTAVNNYVFAEAVHNGSNYTFIKSISWDLTFVDSLPLQSIMNLLENNTFENESELLDYFESNYSVNRIDKGDSETKENLKIAGYW